MSTTPAKNLTPLQQAFLALEKTRAKLDALEQRQHEPVAIIGVGCRFPGGGDSPAEFWRLLRDGVDTITEVPADRWDLSRYYDADPTAPGKIYSRFGGFVNDIGHFDHDFFGIAPREATSLDPQHRLLLETTWEALEHAGLAAERLERSATGVFVGISSFDYGSRVVYRAFDGIDAYLNSGISHSTASGRLSYLFGFQGPCVALDTACSSSLVAVHLACQSLRSGECNLAVAGGVNAVIDPVLSIGFAKARMLAPDGRCKTFDAAANGYVRGEGAGIVVLKRLSDALRDRDPIMAVVRGSAVNQDGPSGGLTVPNGPAQEAVIRRALQFAQVTPDEISYLEAHGTGTQLGDPIELGALHAVFGTSRSTPLPIGSVKTNIGHLEAAAGIAALIKVALMHEHATIAPHLHFRTPNPRAAWPERSVRVATQLEPWTVPTGKRIAGVSSFGFSGTNAHIVVEQPPTPQPGPNDAPPLAARPYVLTLSAKSKPALAALCREQAAWLRRSPQAELGDTSYTLATGRARFNERAAIVADNVAQAVERLEQLATGQLTPHAARSRVRNGAPPRIAFLFPADDTDVAAKLLDLSESYPEAKSAAAACASAIHAAGSNPDSPQAALFTLQVALAQLWRSWGVEPNVCVGQGVGHAVAAFVRGELTLDAAWRRVQTDDTAAHVAIDLNQLVEQGYRIFIELNATGALAEQGQRLFLADTHFWLASLQPGQSAVETLAVAQAKLFASGATFAIERTHDSAARHKLRLPTYRFQRRNFFSPPLESQTVILPWTAIHPLLKTRYTHADGAIVFRSELPTDRAPYLDDHRIGSLAFLPASAYVEMALAAGGDALRDHGGGHVTLRDFQFLKALPLRRDQPVAVQLTLKPSGKQAWSFELCSLPQVDQPASAVLHATGKLDMTQTVEASKPQIAESRDTMTPVTSDELYAKFEGRGLNYGPAFRALRQAWVGDRAVSCEVALPADQAATADHYGLHPVLLDACLQSLAAVESFSQRDRFYLPVAIERVRTFGAVGSRVSARGKIRPASGDSSVVRADFELVSPDGRLLATLDGVQLQALNIESALSTFVALPGGEPGTDVELPPTAEETEMRAELSRVTPAERRELLIGYLQQRLLRVLRRDPTESLDPDTNLFQLGVDSLMSVEFVYDINRGLGVRLPADTLLSYSTIAALADALPAKMAVVEQAVGGAIATQNAKSKWIAHCRPRARAEVRLFCFHHLGGSAELFADWSDRFGERIEVCPVELPGRGTRAEEPAITSLPQIIAALADEMLELADRPFAMLGHSGGTLIAYELAARVRRQFNLQPAALFLGSLGAPHVVSEWLATNGNDEQRLLAHLGQLEPPTVSHTNANEEPVHEGNGRASAAVAEVAPHLITDLRMFANYRATKQRPLDCPLVAILGRDDPLVTRDNMLSWTGYTTGDFRLQMLPGSHGSWLAQRDAIVRLVTQQLLGSST